MERLDIVTMLVLPNLICRLNTILIKISAHYLVSVDNLILKFMWRSKCPRTATRLRRKTRLGIDMLGFLRLTIQLPRSDGVLSLKK